MNASKRFVLALACAGALFALTAAPSSAIVGGHDVPAGQYTSVAEVNFATFGCTGTLIAPNYVLTAGHCGSVTGAAVATTAAWPAAFYTVRIGSNKSGQGESRAVSQVTINPNYTLNQGYDITLLKLATPSTKTPTKVSGSAETALWAAGTLEDIVGWGVTSEGGSAPSTLQAAQVPVTTDAYCANAYGSSFSAQTMLCAGYPQGGVDTCQGDSGGPMFGHTGTGALKVVGVTSFGSGCAQPGFPGVYARVGDSTLREWIRSIVPAGVD
jgi:secreted trypsin-like serine protease